jgi:hypothetical protein
VPMDRPSTTDELALGLRGLAYLPNFDRLRPSRRVAVKLWLPPSSIILAISTNITATYGRILHHQSSGSVLPIVRVRDGEKSPP